MNHITMDCTAHNFASTIHNYCPFCRLEEINKLATGILKRNQGGYDGDRDDTRTIKQLTDVSVAP